MKDQLLKVYRAIHLSVSTYATPPWQLKLTPARLDQLDQNRALQIIAGQLKTTFPEALRMEMEVLSIAAQAQQQVHKSVIARTRTIMLLTSLP